MNANAQTRALPAAGLQTVHWAEGSADLVTIFEPQVQVLVQPRPIDPEIAAYLDASDPAQLGLRRVLDGPHRLTGSDVPTWPALPGRAALIADLRYVAEMYVDLLGCARLGLRFEALDRAMCPGFHRDQTGIRLVCTYRGPGTEWLDDSDPVRHADTESSPLREGSIGTNAAQSAIGRAPAFAIVLLKGTLWQGNAGRGAIHRSPAPPFGGGRRYLLTLDALW